MIRKLHETGPLLLLGIAWAALLLAAVSLIGG